MITGTAVNAAAIVVGGAVGLLIARAAKNRAAKGERVISDSVMKVLGLAVVVLGVHMTLEEHDYFPVVVCLALGTLMGELLKIEARVETFGTWLKKVTKSNSDTFVSSFVFTSVLFCVGATAILGALKDGLADDPSLLYIKSLLDGTTSIIFAGTMGVGVLFSAIPVFIYQGLIALGASQLSFLMENAIYINGISVTGGVMVVGIGLNIMAVTKLRIGNMLPAILLMPLYDALYLSFI